MAVPTAKSSGNLNKNTSASSYLPRKTSLFPNREIRLLASFKTAFGIFISLIFAANLRKKTDTAKGKFLSFRIFELNNVN